MAASKGTFVLAPLSNSIIQGTHPKDLVIAVGSGNQSILIGASNVVPCHMKINSNGFIGVGTSNPTDNLDVNGSVITKNLNIYSSLANNATRPAVSFTVIPGEIHGYGSGGTTTLNKLADDGFLRISAGGGTNATRKTYIDLSGYNANADMTDNIVFGTKGTERVRINEYGLFRTTIIACSVYMSANITIGGGVTTIPFNTTRFNYGNDFDTTTYTFTAPVSGLYHVCCRLQLNPNSPSASSDWIFGYIHVNGSPYASACVAAPVGAMTYSFVVINLNEYIALNANDTVDIRGCIPQSSAFSYVTVINKNSATGGQGSSLSICHIG